MSTPSDRRSGTGTPVGPAPTAPGPPADIGEMPESVAATPRKRQHWIKGMAQGGAVRMGVLPASAVCSVLTARVTISSTGLEAYGYVNTVAMLFHLLPFADLGVGVAVTNAVARRHRGPDGGEKAYLAVLGALRVLIVVCLFLIGAMALLVYSGLLTSWLGLPPYVAEGGETAMFVALATWSCAIPLSVGYRLLVGSGSNTILALGTIIAPVTTLLYSYGLHLVGGPDLLFAVGPALGILLTNLFSTACGVRTVPLPVKRVMKQLLRFREHPGGRVVDTAWPMLLITTAFAVTLYSHRVLLANLVAPEELAVYALVVQLFLPAWSVVKMSGTILWSEFASGQGLRKTWIRANVLLGAISVVGAAGLYVVGPVVVDIMSPDRDVVGSPSFLLAFGVLLIVMGVDAAQTMLLVSAPALRRRAGFAVAACLVFAGLCVPAIRYLGAEGIVWLTCATFFLLQTVPNFVAGYHSSRRRTS